MIALAVAVSRVLNMGGEAARPALAFARISTATMLRSARSLFRFRHHRVARSPWRPDDRADLRAARDRIRPTGVVDRIEARGAPAMAKTHRCPAMSTRLRIVAHGP